MKKLLAVTLGAIALGLAGIACAQTMSFFGSGGTSAPTNTITTESNVVITTESGQALTK